MVWAGILLLLCFIALLSFFSVEGFLIDWYRSLIGLLIGYGFYLMPFALLAAGILLIVKRKGKARLLVACIMILPVLLGALRHLSSDAGRAAYSLKTLAADGRALQGGGILAGSLAALLRAAISDVGAIILCAVFFLVALGIACNTTPAALWRRMRPSPESEEYDEDERQTPAPFNAAAHTPRHQAPRPLTGGKRALDISIGDDQPDLSKPVKKPASTRLAPPSVPTPAEVLAAQQQG